MTKRIRTGIAACLGMLLLILDAKTALAGAKEGVSLCISAVIPSLFPFFVLSNLMTGSLFGANTRFLLHLGRVCGIPEGGESLLITGLLGGYPAGAGCIRQACDAGQLSRNDARRLLSFCSNAGPSFLFGMVAMRFPNISMAWALWGIHILSALLVGILFSGKAYARISLTKGQDVSLSGALKTSLRIMASVCGWVVIFRVVIAMLSRWCLWLLPQEGQIVIMGILELTNGCCDLEQIGSVGLRFICAAGLLGFGGLCVLMQTASVVGDLGIRSYLTGRILCAVFSVLLAAVDQSRVLGGGNLLVPLLLLFLIAAAVLVTRLKKRKNSSIPAKISV